ncbi:hypothetical protein [Tateyamaria sp. SN3-11]|uniref:hypothetical protein n=1 Tax=Tateyamaria sp. SN3-11 TaxID=3092147 RepID=UPI0039EB515F
MFYSHNLRLIFLLLLFILTISTWYFAVLRPLAFSRYFAAEDHLVEYSTAILLALASVSLAALSRRVVGYKSWLLVFYALAFMIAAGEEVSWGQRIFGIKSNEFFLKNNFQGETNIHNLVVGGEQLVEFWFGTLLSATILAYLVVIPLLYPISPFVRGALDFLAVPVAERWVAPVAVVWSGFVVWIDLPRNWEIYECVFAILICTVFLGPKNPETFNFEKALQ